MSAKRKRNLPRPCRCDAYPFPHRPGGGACESDPDIECSHHKYFDPYEWQYRRGEYCPYCDYSPLYDERSEALSAAERNPGLCGRRY